MAQKKPLTLEELLEMNGKPAYWAEDESYGIISVDDGGRWEGIPFFNGRKNGVDFKYDIQARKMTVYAVEPPRLDRKAWEPCTKCGSCFSCVHSTKNINDSRNACFWCEQKNQFNPMNFCPKCGRPLTDEAWQILEKRIEN